jgi:hypothetical protein
MFLLLLCLLIYGNLGSCLLLIISGVYSPPTAAPAVAAGNAEALHGGPSRNGLFKCQDHVTVSPDGYRFICVRCLSDISNGLWPN